MFRAQAGPNVPSKSPSRKAERPSHRAARSSRSVENCPIDKLNRRVTMRATNRRKDTDQDDTN
jgi:hypothetical protein